MQNYPINLHTKGILWDLGGLFIQVHPERLPGPIRNPHTVFEECHRAFECGICSEFDFEEAIRKALQDGNTGLLTEITGESARSIWNLVLGKWNLMALEQIQPLRKHYAMVLLSNTNSWHEEAFTATLKEAGGQSLDHYFDRVVFSHHYRMRKPNPKLYESAVHGLKTPGGEEIPMESWLFLDDSQENLDGAASLGLQTCLHPRNTSPLNTLRGYLAPWGLPGTPGF